MLNNKTNEREILNLSGLGNDKPNTVTKPQVSQPTKKQIQPEKKIQIEPDRNFSLSEIEKQIEMLKSLSIKN